MAIRPETKSRRVLEWLQAAISRREGRELPELPRFKTRRTRRRFGRIGHVSMVNNFAAVLQCRMGRVPALSSRAGEIG